MQSSLIPMPVLSDNAGVVTLVDFSTGTLGGGGSISSITDEIPEPGTLWLLGAGLIVLAWRARARRPA
jgi:hypothetical protein